MATQQKSRKPLFRKPGDWQREQQSRSSKHHPSTANPYRGPMLSNPFTGLSTRRGRMDSRGNTYRHVPSGQKKGAKK